MNETTNRNRHHLRLWVSFRQSLPLAMTPPFPPSMTFDCEGKSCVWILTVTLLCLHEFRNERRYPWFCLEFHIRYGYYCFLSTEKGRGLQWLVGHRGSKEGGGPKDRCVCKKPDCLLSNWSLSGALPCSMKLTFIRLKAKTVTWMKCSVLKTFKAYFKCPLPLRRNSCISFPSVNVLFFSVSKSDAIKSLLFE